MPINTPRSDFKIQKGQLEKKRRTFRVYKKRGTHMIYMGVNAVSISKERKRTAIKDKVLNREVVNLIANVAKNVNQFIIKSDFEFEIEKERHDSTWTNRDMYDALEDGTEFWYVDIAHCYWRIAYLKGYISENMYKLVLEKPHLKTYRNMALACIVSEGESDYIVNGKFIHTITEDRHLHRLIYDNIRFTCYNLMGDIVQAIGARHVVGWRTDGILVLPDFKDEVVQLIMEQDYQCTEKIISKHGNYFYRYKDGTEKHL